MPYILPFHRRKFDELVDQLAKAVPQDSDKAGMLNYIITTLLLRTLPEKPRYKDYNEAVGVLGCAALEFYRRSVVPYEERKCAEAGDVYPAKDEVS